MPARSHSRAAALTVSPAAVKSRASPSPTQPTYDRPCGRLRRGESTARCPSGPSAPEPARGRDAFASMVGAGEPGNEDAYASSPTNLSTSPSIDRSRLQRRRRSAPQDAKTPLATSARPSQSSHVRPRTAPRGRSRRPPGCLWTAGGTTCKSRRLRGEGPYAMARISTPPGPLNGALQSLQRGGREAGRPRSAVSCVAAGRSPVSIRRHISSTVSLAIRCMLPKRPEACA